MAELVRCLYENVHAVGAGTANEECRHKAEIETSIQKRHWHCQYTAAEWALQKMDQRVHITEIIGKIVFVSLDMVKKIDNPYRDHRPPGV